VRLVRNNAERSKNRGIAFSSQFLIDYGRIVTVVIDDGLSSLECGSLARLGSNRSDSLRVVKLNAPSTSRHQAAEGQSGAGPPHSKELSTGDEF